MSPIDIKGVLAPIYLPSVHVACSYFTKVSDSI